MQAVISRLGDAATRPKLNQVTQHVSAIGRQTKIDARIFSKLGPGDMASIDDMIS